MPGCRTTKSPRRQDWRAVRLEPRWRGRAGDWSKPMMQDRKEDSMSHVDEGTVHAYLDGELPSTERAALEAHLAGCAACRGNLIEERSLRERASAVLGSARPAEHPAPPLDQLRRAPKRSPWRVRRSFAWAASIALALGLGYSLRTPARLAPANLETQRVDLSQNRAVSTQEEKPQSQAQSNVQAPAQRPSNDRRQARAADKLVARDDPRADSAAQVAIRVRGAAVAPATPRLADSISADARVASSSAAPSLFVDGALVRQKLAANWPVISRRVAKTILGEEPVGLPGLETRTFRRDPGTNAVMVEQALYSSTVSQIFQRPAARAYAYDSSEAASASANRAQPRAYTAEGQLRERGNRLFARFVRGLRVEIKGPLSADSLNRLLEQVAPLP